MFRAIASFFTAAYLWVAAVFVSEPPQPAQLAPVETLVNEEQLGQIPFPTEDVASNSATTEVGKTVAPTRTPTPIPTSTPAAASTDNKDSRSTQAATGQTTKQSEERAQAPTATRAPKPTSTPTAIPAPTATPTPDTTAFEASLNVESAQSVVQANKQLTACNYLAAVSTVSSNSVSIVMHGAGDVSSDHCTLPKGSDGYRYLRVEITSASGQTQTLEWGEDPNKPRPCSPNDERLICTQG